MTKLELATLIVGGLDKSQKYMATPAPSRSPMWHERYEAASPERQDELLALHLANKRTMAELEAWAEQLTAPE